MSYPRHYDGLKVSNLYPHDQVKVLLFEGHGAKSFQYIAYGEGVNKDYKNAIHWYLKAKKLGDAVAKSALGKMYCDGEGALQDLDMLTLVPHCLHYNGHGTAKPLRDDVRKKGTKSDSKKAKTYPCHLMRSQSSVPRKASEGSASPRWLQRFLYSLIDYTPYGFIRGFLEYAANTHANFAYQ